MDTIISRRLSSDRLYAYHKNRFWLWDDTRGWKESHLMSQKFEREHAARPTLTPVDFMTDLTKFQQLDSYEIDSAMLDALKDARPCKTAPVEPVEEERPTPSAQYSDAATVAESQTVASPAAPEGSSLTMETADVANGADAQGNAAGESAALSAGSGSFLSSPAAPTFDFGADDQTNALLLQDAQTFITGNMARIMAAKHAHDLCANNKNGTWGRWCNAVGISRDTGDNMVHIAEQFGNIQIDGQPIFDVRPMKLLYAAAKPSTPEEVKQAVFTGDITTYKEYQEALAQIKAEKDRANAAEAERDKLLGAQNRAAWAESHIQDVEAQRDAALADVQGLTEQNARLNAEKEKAVQSYNEMYESRIAANLQRQKAEAERDRAEARAHKAEDALKHQPITAVVDEEEVERRAAEKAWGLADARNRELQEENDRLKKNSAQLERRMKAVTSRMDDLGQTDFETANHCPEAMLAIWNSCKGSYSRLTGEDLENTFSYICNTLNSIRQEAALLCRQPEGYDGGAA